MSLEVRKNAYDQYDSGTKPHAVRAVLDPKNGKF